MLSLFISALLLTAPIADATKTCSSGQHHHQQQPIVIALDSARDGASTVQPGLSISLGSPHQNVPLFPSLRRNDTVVAAPTYCDVSSHNENGHAVSDRCGRDIATFDVSRSRSWNGTAATNSSLSGVEDVHLSTATTIRLPIEVRLDSTNDNDNTPTLGLGLGPGSTLLTAATDSGAVPSRSFSLFVGTGLDHVRNNHATGHANGSLVLGGFDQSRFEAPDGSLPAHPFDTTSSDVLAVEVVDVVVHTHVDGLGTSADDGLSLFDPVAFPDTPAVLLKSESSESRTGFKAALSTDQFPLSLPAVLVDNFVKAFPVAKSDQQDGSVRYTSDIELSMTVTLANGLAVTIPPEVMRSPSGFAAVSSKRSGDNDGPFLLGTAFLTQTYLMVDYDDQKFYLANAVASGSKPMVTPWCSGTVPTPAPTTKKHIPSVATIVGSALGGTAFLVGLVVAAMYVRAYRRIKAEEAEFNSFEYDHDHDHHNDGWDIEKHAGVVAISNLRTYSTDSSVSGSAASSPPTTPTPGSKLLLSMDTVRIQDGTVSPLPPALPLHPTPRSRLMAMTLAFRRSEAVRQKQIRDYCRRVESDEQAAETPGRVDTDAGTDAGADGTAEAAPLRPKKKVSFDLK